MNRLPVKSLLAVLMGLAVTSINAANDGWNVGEVKNNIPAEELSRIGLAVCTDGLFEISDGAVVCSTCPGYTGNAGDQAEMSINVRHVGHFSSGHGPKEWLLDTDGCEPHYVDFGGAILLRESETNASTTPLNMLFYRPGFRVSDCLNWETKDSPALLVCNEVSTAQGESVGHISMLDIDQKSISRWRLLRWYDNSGGIQPDIVAIIPQSMKKVKLANGQPALRIELIKRVTSRESFERNPELMWQSSTLDFKLRGRRFFATEPTQHIIGEVSVLLRGLLE
jgi:hypothetical protein